MNTYELAVSSPGRMCLLGEHQDYFGLAIIAAAFDIAVRLRGRLAPELWPPHDGMIRPGDSAQGPGASGPVTRVRAKLPPIHSVFLVDAEPGPDGGAHP